jgi:hypothetical protein
LAGVVLAARPDDQDAELGGLALKVTPGVALVADHGQRAGALDAGEQFQRDLALAGLGTGQRECPGRAVGGEQAVQPEAPKKRLWLAQ